MEFSGSPVPSHFNMLSMGALPTSPAGFTSSSESQISTTLPWAQPNDPFSSAGRSPDDFSAFLPHPSPIDLESFRRPSTPELEEQDRFSCSLEALPNPKSGHRPGPINTLIKCAILGSPERKLRSSDIRNAIVARFPSYFEDEVDRTHLDSTVRHNLSHAPQFALAPKSPGVKGKGRPWMYNPEKDPQASRFRRRGASASSSSRATAQFEPATIRRSTRKPSRNSTILPSRPTSESRPILPARPRTSGPPYSDYTGSTGSSLSYSQQWTQSHNLIETIPSPSSSGYDTNRSDGEWSATDVEFGLLLRSSGDEPGRDDQRLFSLDPSLFPPSVYDMSVSTPNLGRCSSYDPTFSGGASRDNLYKTFPHSE